MAKSNLIVGITGGSGSGKTYLVNKILGSFNPEEITVLSQDNYYKELNHLTIEERSRVNFDHPDSLDFDLMAEHITALQKNSAVEIPVYDFATHTRKDYKVKIEPASLVLLDGILIMSSTSILNVIDIKIYIDTPSDIRLLRRIERDMRERGRTLDSILLQYQQTVRPMYKQFIEPVKKECDLILSGEVYHSEIVNILKDRLKNRE